MRLVDVGADAWKDLDWGTGIWTDEGFYAHNARNQVLFAKPEQDGFNNYNLSPVLHAIQVWVFTQFGVGLVQARLISIVASLIACGVLYAAVRIEHGHRPATYALMLLGLESSFLLYNRLGLMESLGALVIAASYLFWALDKPWSRMISGFIAASAFAVKTTFLIYLPAPILAVIVLNGPHIRSTVKKLWPFIVGAGLFLVTYYLTWLAVHGADVARMNNFYRTMQSQPRSISQLLWMMRRALIGYHFGFFQRMETRSTVFLNLSMIGAIWSGGRFLQRRKVQPLTPHSDVHHKLLPHIICLITGFLFIFVSRYAPSRYFLVFYVSAAVVGGVTLNRLPTILSDLMNHAMGRLALLVAICLFGFHLLQPLFNLGGFRNYSEILGVIVALMLAFAAISHRIKVIRNLKPKWVVAMFLVTSLGQYAAWFVTRGHETLRASIWLTQQVGSQSVVAGDWAPNLGFGTRLRLPPVFKGLANDHDPIRTLRVEYVLTGRTPYPKRMWAQIAPGLLVDDNRVSTLNYHGYTIDLYRVPDAMK